MPNDDISIVSTTDSAAEVQSALTGKPVEPEPEPAQVAAPATPSAPPAATPVAAATPATPATEAVPPAEATPAATDATAAVTDTPEQTAARESSRKRRADKIQAEIDEATRRKHDARRDADAEEERLADLRRKRTALEAVVTPPPAAVAAAATTTKPKLDDVDAVTGAAKYPSYEDYVSAVSAWDKAELQREFDGKLAALKAEQEQTERARIERAQVSRVEATAAQNYEAKATTFRGHTPDFDAVLESAKEFVLELLEDNPNALSVIDRYTVHDADNGPAINHYLARHPDEMRRIAALPVPLQLAQLGKLDARLEAAQTPVPARPPAAPVSNAPEPISPVSSAPTASSVSPEEEDYRVYAARRNREERERAASMAR